MSMDKIVEIIYIQGEFCLLSPLLIGSGEESQSDIDLIRDWDKKPFLPASSLSGVIRNYLETGLENSDHTLIDTLFGKREDDATQSIIYFYDAPLINDAQIQLRDGVALETFTKTAKKNSKYDYEVLEAGNRFRVRMELVLRERHNQRELLKELLHLLLKELTKGKILLGRKTRRGMGKGKLENIRGLWLDMCKEDDQKKWLNFSWDNLSDVPWDKWGHESIALKKDMWTNISVQFELPYSLMIRHYNTDPNGADMIHLDSNQFPVIPGTSWAGLLRHTAEKLGKEMEKDLSILLKELFGDVDKKKAIPSRIFIQETILNNSKKLCYTRNRIDRFTGGTVETALFDEQAEYGPKQVYLELRIQDAKKYEIGLILLVLRELWYGLEPIGGEASIGRGILQGKSLQINHQKIDFFEQEDEPYLTALATRLHQSE